MHLLVNNDGAISNFADLLEQNFLQSKHASLGIPHTASPFPIPCSRRTDTGTKFAMRSFNSTRDLFGTHPPPSGSEHDVVRVAGTSICGLDVYIPELALGVVIVLGSSCAHTWAHAVEVMEALCMKRTEARPNRVRPSDLKDGRRVPMNLSTESTRMSVGSLNPNLFEGLSRLVRPTTVIVLVGCQEDEQNGNFATNLLHKINVGNPPVGTSTSGSRARSGAGAQGEWISCSVLPMRDDNDALQLLSTVCTSTRRTRVQQEYDSRARTLRKLFSTPDALIDNVFIGNEALWSVSTEGAHCILDAIGRDLSKLPHAAAPGGLLQRILDPEDYIGLREFLDREEVT